MTHSNHNIGKHLTIFEGPDGSGKTTAARDYAHRTHALYVHFNNLPKVTTGLGRMYVEAMLPALLGYQDVVFDRCWLSEIPYGKAFRGGQDRLGTPSRRMLERLALRCGAVVVQCQPPLETCLANFNKRREIEMLQSNDQLTQVYLEYLEQPTALPRVLFDYTRALSDITDLEAEVVDRQPPRHDVRVPSAGHLGGKIIMVGEKFTTQSDCDPFYQWPFASFSRGGCSQWLAEQLEAAGIGEERLYWVNADQLERSMLYHRLDEGAHVVALGQVASVLLERLSIAHVIFDHPQAHKRFSHHQPYPLVTYLKEVLA